MKHKKASEIFTEYLKTEKHRITPERFEVLDAALDYHGHFGADDLYVAMKNKKSGVSRATVYKTLELLAHCELLSRRNFGDNMTRYESNYRRENHDHFICITCGKIVEFTNDGIQEILDEISKSNNFEISGYSFNVFGHCKDKAGCK